MKWIFVRLIRSVLTALIVISLTFFLMRLMPGNPVEMTYYHYITVLRLDPEQAKMLVKASFNIDFDSPIHVQYLNYMYNLFTRGDLGKSLTRGSPVIEIISNDLPWSVFTLSIAIFSSFLLGILLGSFLAYRGGIIDKIFTQFFTILSCIPSYIIGIFLIFILILQLRMFPSGGRVSLGVKPGFTLEFIADVLWHAALPTLSYLLVYLGGWVISMKGSAISVLGSDYVLAAEARGLKKRKIMQSYVMRNAILPLFTSLMISLGYMFGGAVFIENLFAYPGIGYTLMWALNNRDYPLLQGILNIIILAIILSNLVADLTYSMLDPRVRRGESA
jgi:peptide/nickel transport system permease protein